MPVAELRGVAAAVAFLTCVPIGRALTLGASDLARGVVAFPLVGAAIGAAVGAAATAGGQVLPQAMAGVIALAVAVVLTGALHLDGMADTADALGARTREQALAIMRDSRVGSYGATAIALVLLFEGTALGTLGAAERTSDVAAVFALSRAAAALVAALVPYARDGDGLGRALGGRRRLLLAVAVGVVAAAVLHPRHAPALVGSALGCAVASAWFCRRWFGGLTGDTLGATIAVAECACLVVACTR